MVASVIMCVGMYFGAYPISLVSMAVGSYQTIVDPLEKKKRILLNFIKINFISVD
jgi:hypothetical protein